MEIETTSTPVETVVEIETTSTPDDNYDDYCDEPIAASHCSTRCLVRGATAGVALCAVCASLRFGDLLALHLCTVCVHRRAEATCWLWGWHCACVVAQRGLACATAVRCALCVRRRAGMTPLCALCAMRCALGAGRCTFCAVRAMSRWGDSLALCHFLLPSLLASVGRR